MPWPRPHWVWSLRGRCRQWCGHGRWCTPEQGGDDGEVDVVWWRWWRWWVLNLKRGCYKLNHLHLSIEHEEWKNIANQPGDLKYKPSEDKWVKNPKEPGASPRQYEIRTKLDIHKWIKRKKNLEHRPDNPRVPAYRLRVAADRQEVALQRHNYNDEG